MKFQRAKLGASFGLNIESFLISSTAPKCSDLSYQVKPFLHLQWMLLMDHSYSFSFLPSPAFDYRTPILLKYDLHVIMGEGSHPQLQGWLLISPSHLAHGILLVVLCGPDVGIYPELAQSDLKEALVFHGGGRYFSLSPARPASGLISLDTHWQSSCGHEGNQP